MNYTESSRLQPESGSGKACPVTTSLEKALLVLIAVIVAVGIGLTITVVSLFKEHDRYLRIIKPESNEKTCHSSACVTEASTLLKSLDRNVDPCTDFYTFACGKWLENTHLLSGMESRFSKLSKSNILKVKEILEGLQKEKDLPDHSKKVSEFYKSCMDRTSRNIKGAEVLKKDLKKFGGWPLIDGEWNVENFKWDDLLIEFFKNGYISTMLFHFRVGTDPMNTSRTILEVRYPTIGLNHKEFYSLALDNIIKLYKETIFRIAKLLNGDIKKDESVEAIDKAFEIEYNITKLLGDLIRDPRYRYHIMTLEELENKYSKIPWKKLFQNMLPPETELSNSERVSVASPTMLEGLNDLMEKLENDEGKKNLANYMFYRIVFFAAHHLSLQYQNLIAILNEKQGINRTPQWDACLRTTLEIFHIPVSSIYAQKYLDVGTKNLLETFFKDLKHALADDIKDADWLDEETRSQALLKVSNMRAIIGYEDDIMKDDVLDEYYKDINITNKYFENVKEAVVFQRHKSMEGLNEKHIRMRWPEIANLLIANAYYRPDQNAIIIPVGILQDPFFYPGRPNYINYGSLGMIVAHELTHAFDKVGGLYDDKGNFKIWWSDESWGKFRNKTKCYQDQYNNYYVPDAEAYVNGTLTLGENIADNGGLKTAYHAYNKILSRIKTEKALPGLPYNEKQMFWISFASIWCKKQSEDNIRFAMKHFYHTPSKFRVIGCVSNMKEFSEDFNCKKNSDMNPESKCSLWK